MFQMQFSTITAAVVSGGVVQRVSLWAWLLFSVLWQLIVYIPLARWVFYPGGFLAVWGVQDTAGGIVVETASGVSGYVFAYWLGAGSAAARATKPHNLPLMLLGIGL